MCRVYLSDAVRATDLNTLLPRDKFQKWKIMVFIGYGFSTVVKPFFAVASTAWDALFLRKKN
jgi:hypothetical protein